MSKKIEKDQEQDQQIENLRADLKDSVEKDTEQDIKLKEIADGLENNLQDIYKQEERVNQLFADIDALTTDKISSDSTDKKQNKNIGELSTLTKNLKTQVSILEDMIKNEKKSIKDVYERIYELKQAGLTYAYGHNAQNRDINELNEKAKANINVDNEQESKIKRNKDEIDTLWGFVRDLNQKIDSKNKLVNILTALVVASFIGTIFSFVKVFFF